MASERTLPTAPSRPGYFRWVICGLLLLGTTKNYMDRWVLSALKTTLQHDLGWNEINYSDLVVAFQAAYAVGMLAVGRFIDRFGTRLGYAIIMVFWSLASMAHAVGSSFSSFLMARVALGFGESGVFPASIKAVAEWFPAKERALATGIFNAGTNMGVILAGLSVPWITAHFGWRWAFVIVGSLGFAWLALWLLVYQRPEDHPRCSKAELEYIRGDMPQPTQKIKWLSLLPYRQTWAFACGKFLIDPIWWFYLFWVPDFLERRYGLHLAQIGLPVVVIYLISDVGSVAGGWLSSFLIRRGVSVNAGRKIAMLLCAITVVPIVSAYHVSGLWPAVLLIGLAAAGHQGFSANLYTLTSDMFPSRAVASVVGIGGMAGAVGGMLIAKIVGHVLQWTGSYMVPFFIAGSVYLVALAAIHVLAPRLEPAKIN
ncbi:MAG TPA: MFS transporter [Candidatus Acidoferrum sp.]|nr:MFS transporter [Candidatus Acidoferrum sp.]